MGVGAGLYMYDIVVKKFTLAISSPDEFLVELFRSQINSHTETAVKTVPVTCGGKSNKSSH